LFCLPFFYPAAFHVTFFGQLQFFSVFFLANFFLFQKFLEEKGTKHIAAGKGWAVTQDNNPKFLFSQLNYFTRTLPLSTFFSHKDNTEGGGHLCGEKVGEVL
jgi:hypothetical protein